MPQLLPMQEGGSACVHSAILEALDKLSPEGLLGVLPQMQPSLEDSDKEVRTTAIEMLVRLPSKGLTKIAPSLLNSLSDSDKGVRESAANLLVKFTKVQKKHKVHIDKHGQFLSTAAGKSLDKEHADTKARLAACSWQILKHALEKKLAAAVPERLTRKHLRKERTVQALKSRKISVEEGIRQSRWRKEEEEMLKELLSDRRY